MGEFDTRINRRGTHSVKWDMHPEEDLLHLWVADMDFAAPKPIQDALRQRAEHGVFGYTIVGDSVREAIMEWMKKRHNWSVAKGSISFLSGVVPALSLAVQAFTKPKDRILVQPPVYTPFFDMVTRNDRQAVLNPLSQDGQYKMDFVHLEKQFQQGVSMMILCSPHNPVGRVWTKEELETVGELCQTYDVLVVSDEIHSDLILPGYVHTPLASLSPSLSNRTVTCIAPSKTFNIAGLQAAAVIIENEQLRERFSAVMHQQGFHTLNVFASAAMQAAYTECESWLEDLLLYLNKNIEFACTYIEKEIPALKAYHPEGTYLLWVDCSKLQLSKEERLELLKERGRIIVEPGEKFGQGGEGFIRMNLGCPRSMLEEALIGLKEAVYFHIRNAKA
ncbi:MalY/PatB family protein [Ectobacillus panaciterrae]|uniref:MalY/PatB family protein n=1 Tax=Ectobacillus panaciterrae TaxID=363872 RepID=UPI000417BA28|nr:MalY/PatB family protein [Ectobacillus panaciterrae]